MCLTLILHIFFLNEIQLSHSRYEADWMERKALEEKELLSKKRQLEEITWKAVDEKENESINGKVNQCKGSWKVADGLTFDAKNTLQEFLAGKIVDHQLKQKALVRIEIGRVTIKSDLEVLHSEKKAFSGWKFVFLFYGFQLKKCCKLNWWIFLLYSSLSHAYI